MNEQTCSGSDKPSGERAGVDFVQQILSGLSAGNQRARRAFKRVAPRMEGACGEALRDCSYVLAFGATFGTLLAAEAIPCIIRAGARGGREAARRAWQARRRPATQGKVREVPISS
ncbi:MAG TPA: hypothetical protein VMN36_10705 [Verrucomicrobiales bacterium]|nr:hypothetical protein [Verrucomicrobiales bacterium]